MHWVNPLLVVIVVFLVHVAYPGRVPFSVVLVHGVFVAIVYALSHRPAAESVPRPPPVRESAPSPPKRNRKLTEAQRKKLNRALAKLN